VTFKGYLSLQTCGNHEVDILLRILTDLFVKEAFQVPFKMKPSDRQTRAGQASVKKAEECSRRPSQDKEVSVQDLQTLHKTVLDLKQKLADYNEFTEEFKKLKSSMEEENKTVLDLKQKLADYNEFTEDFKKFKSSMEEENKTVLELKSSMEEENKSLKYVSEQSESNYDEIYCMRSENAQLRKEVDLLRATVIKMDRKITSLEDEVTDLRSRSMRDNILIHNYAYSPGENLAHSVPNVIKDVLGVDVDFIRIHRNSVKGLINSRPVTITAKLVDRSKKDELLQAQKTKKLAKVRLPFFITTQEPPSVVESKKRLYAISDSQRGQNIRSKVEKGQVVMPNGEVYTDPVPKMDTSDILQLSAEEVATLDDLAAASTNPTKTKGSEIFATGIRVNAIEDVQNLYKKVCVDPYSAAANHRILVYRFTDTNGKIQESYWDDGEHGAGRQMLQYMRTNKIQNLAVILTRWSGPIRLGPNRFRIMEEHLGEVARLVDDEDEDESLFEK
jgi:myosin heavy subunit